MDEYEERLRKIREEALLERERFKAEVAEIERLRADFDCRFDRLVEKIWQVIQEVAKPTKLGTYRISSNRRHYYTKSGSKEKGSYVEGRWEHLYIYDPTVDSDFEGGGLDAIGVPVGSFLSERRYHLVAGVSLRRRERYPANLVRLEGYNPTMLEDIELCKMTDEEIVKLVKEELQESVIRYVTRHPSSI